MDYLAGANASSTSVTVIRNDTGVNMPDLSKVANVHWQVTSSRTSLGADVTFHYLAQEITGLLEMDLTVYKASTLGGTYYPVPTRLDMDHNTATIYGVNGFFLLCSCGGSPAIGSCGSVQGRRRCSLVR